MKKTHISKGYNGDLTLSYCGRWLNNRTNLFTSYKDISDCKVCLSAYVRMD